MTNEELESLSLDEVFGNPDVNPSNPNAPVATPTPEVQATPPPQASEPFLRTASGTVYKSAEDAAKGVEHKDQLIAKLRQEAIDRTGIDPVTGQPVRREPEAPKSYTQDRKRFVEDLSKAAQANDAEAYSKVYEQFVGDILAPYAPLLQDVAKTKAIENVSQRIPEFRQFVGSVEYKEALDRFPTLRDAISVTERNPQATDQAAELYQMAFELAQKKPEVVRAQAQPIPRPTVTSTSLPSLPQNGSAAAPSMGTPEGRKALIEAQERAGVLDFRL